VSHYYEPDSSDISIDVKNEQVDIFVNTDDWGNNYLSIPFETLFDLCEKIKKEKPSEEGLKGDAK